MENSQLKFQINDLEILNDNLQDVIEQNNEHIEQAEKSVADAKYWKDLAQKKEFEIQSIKFNHPKIDSNEFQNSLAGSEMDSPRNEVKNKMQSARTFTMESPTKNTLC